jgi:hypothetical protein|tara:strand:- start:18532 stop:19671 length:1140 start_codon:yes stop_codon:yes gene_type:complete
MANTITSILDKILAQGLVTLREAAVMPRLTNVDYSATGAQQGNTIDVPTPKTQAVSTVAVSNVLKSPADKVPGLVQISLDQWKMTDFHLTDKEMAEIDRNRHFVPMQTSEAARALANNIDNYIHSQYTGIYGYVGTAATTPFSTVATATNARKVLNDQLAPMNDRRIVMDPTAESQALQLTAYSDIEKSGDTAVKIEGEVGRKFGMDHYMSQNVNTHTGGTASASITVGSTTAIGVSTLQFKSGVGTKTVVLGDVFTIAGDSQTYVATSSANITSTGVNVTVDPALKVIASATSAITMKATHVVNLAFQRNAFAYVTRPLQDSVGALTGGNPQSALVDNQTGLTLRLEVVRQHKQSAWQFDVLYGAKLVRPELACRIAG